MSRSQLFFCQVQPDLTHKLLSLTKKAKTWPSDWLTDRPTSREALASKNGIDNLGVIMFTKWQLLLCSCYPRHILIRILIWPNLKSYSCKTVSFCHGIVPCMQPLPALMNGIFLICNLYPHYRFGFTINLLRDFL